MIAATDIDISLGGLVLGVILGAIVYLVVDWLLSRTPLARYATVIAVVLAILVFLVLAFDVYSTEV